MSVKVTVIIPNYNHARYLHQRINSILIQTYQDFEIIILDDQSSDDSLEVIKQFSNHPKIVNIVLNQENSGSTFIQWERGLKLAKGEWVWIAESDDYCDSDFLTTLFDKGIPEIAGVRFSQSIPVDEKECIVGEPMPAIESGLKTGIEFLTSSLLELNRVPNASSVLVKKSLLERVLTNDVKKFKLVGDWLVWCRLALITNYYFTEETKNYHRVHSNTVRNTSSKSGNYFSEFSEFRRIFHLDIQKSETEIDDKNRLSELNRNFSYKEAGLRGCELVRNKKYFRSIIPILTATVKPKPTLYYLKSALYWFFKSL